MQAAAPRDLQIRRSDRTSADLAEEVAATDTEDLDLLGVVHFLTDGGPGQIGLPAHHAHDRVAELLRYLEHLQRIVSITNFEIKQTDKQAVNKTVDARFDLTAYYVSSEKLQKAAASQPKTATPGSVNQVVNQAVAPGK